MQSFDIVKQSDAPSSFRAKAVMGQFDLNIDRAIERFQGEFALPNDWNIGVIHGASGTGKTTISKEIFEGDYFQNPKYKGECVLDDMPKDASVKEILNMFNTVGFSSTPSYLKPYDVLSNGEKMRVDLARAFLESDDLVVFDEFTSVVDRNVARSACIAIAKSIRRTKRKFIAVSCHSDILNWLEADWSFSTDDMKFSDNKKKESRSTLKSDDARETNGDHLASIII